MLLKHAENVSASALAIQKLFDDAGLPGGADAFIVRDDADIDKTVAWAVFGRHGNAGQVCVSAKRLIIADAVYDEFMGKYRGGLAALQASDPRDPATQLAPLSTQKAANNLAAEVATAIDHGTTAETLGQLAPAPRGRSSSR